MRLIHTSEATIAEPMLGDRRFDWATLRLLFQGTGKLGSVQLCAELKGQNAGDQGNK
jgi:hypothetical protein